MNDLLLIALLPFPIWLSGYGLYTLINGALNVRGEWDRIALLLLPVAILVLALIGGKALQILIIKLIEII